MFDKLRGKTASFFRERPRLFWSLMISVDVLAMAAFGALLYGSVKSRFAPYRLPKKPRQAQLTVFLRPEKIQKKPAEAVSSAPVSEVQIFLKPVEAARVSSAPAAAEINKARRIVFRYYDGKAKAVSLFGGFTSGKLIPMTRRGAKWETALYVLAGEYRYGFSVDGKKIADPAQPLRRAGATVLIVGGR